MKKLNPEEQVKLEQLLQEAARLMKQGTESDKLQDFESIEIELRDQLRQRVAPILAEVFLSQTQSERQKHKER